MTSAFSWQNSISLWPASFHIPRPNLPVTPGVSWLPTFAFQSPIMKRTSFWGVSSERSCRSHITIQLQLLQHYWLGHRLILPWYWMICFGNEQRSFCLFLRLHSSIAFLTLCDPMNHSTPGLPVHLIPRMSTFTLAVSCLTTSNLPWFMDLTFQVPMQYCSFYSIRPCFYHQSHPQLGIVFALAPSLHSGVISPLISCSILDTYRPGEFLIQYPIILPFHTVHGVFKARILKWFAIPFSSGPHSVTNILRHM